MQVSHQFNFVVIGHCQKHCIFFHFRSNLLDEKLHVQLRIQYSKTPGTILRFFCHVMLVILKIGVDVVYALFSSTAISVAAGICIKQMLFSFFQCEHAVSASWIQKNRYVLCCVLCFQINFFWCANRAYFVTPAAHCWISSFFLRWIQVSLRFVVVFGQKTCLFFHCYSKLLVTSDLCIFPLLILEYWILA